VSGFLLQVQDRFLPDNGDSSYESLMYVAAAFLSIWYSVY